MPSFTKLLTGAVSSFSDQLGNLPQYTYPPLPHPRCIRLLELHPLTSGLLLSFTLHVYDLDGSDEQVYDALSYTWGNPLPPVHRTPAPSLWTIPRPIMCNGAVLRVTTNLQTALRKLREYASKPGSLAMNRLIWVDAICINQADTAERSAQVSMMEDIYSRAQRVIVWLGLSDRLTGPAIRCIKHLSEFPDSAYNKSRDWTLQQKGVPPSDARAMVGFFMREWFNRAWVVQEVALASSLTILCGDYQLEWKVLARCSQFLHHCIEPTDLMVYVPEFLSREQIQSGRMVKRLGYDVYGLDTLRSLPLRDELELDILISYVYMGRIKDSTDPRDRFFAMLGLLRRHPAVRNNQSLRARIPAADYSKSVAEVFADCAVLVLELTDKIPLLLLSMVEDRCRRSPELMDELPSWVPDLKVPISPDPMLRMSPKGDDGNPKAKLWDPTLDYNDNIANPVPIDGRFLCIYGGMFDTITQLSAPLETNDRSFSWIHVLKTFRPHWASVISGTAFMEAIWRTLAANMESPSASMPADASFGWGFVEMLLRRAVRGRAPHDSQGLIDVLTQASFASGAATPIAPDKIQQCLAIMRGPRSPQTAAIEARIDAYEKIMTSVCGTRRLFLTSGNYMGIGAQSVEVGDQVWIFPGANVPFVLRPGAAGRFRLVGEAYVHGVMYGEIAPSLVERYQGIELE